MVRPVRWRGARSNIGLSQQAGAEVSAALAFIPIENSLHGRVADIHFLLPESGLSIVGEHFLRVHHCLMSKESDIAAIKTAMEKLGVESQALGQAIYEATQAEQAAGAGAGAPSGAAADDNVVDAEVVEDDQENK